MTTIALLPPSSRIVRPNRPATTSRDATAHRGRAGERDRAAGAGPSSICSPTVRPGPTTRLKTPCDAVIAPSRDWRCAARRSRSAASARDGFHTTGSPHTAASAAFHAHTATGKLNAVITPTGPSGCHCSHIRWPGRSDVHRQAVELAREARPRSRRCRSSPAPRRGPRRGSCPSRARPSSPSGSFASRSAVPRSRTRSPRLGAGRSRQISNARAAPVGHACTAARRRRDRRDRHAGRRIDRDERRRAGSSIQPSAPKEAPALTSIRAATFREQGP